VSDHAAIGHCLWGKAITAITFCDTTPRMIAFLMMNKSINFV
jgi:hypothetical protein